MCTIVDKEATIEKRKSLKSTGNIAWKIVYVTNEGEYQPLHFRIYTYNKTGQNIAKTDPLSRFRSSDSIKYDGVFHMFTSRCIARRVLKAYKVFYPNTKVKIVKVLYNKKDFVCLGESDRISSKMRHVFKKGELDVVCLKQFTFAENK